MTSKQQKLAVLIDAVNVSHTLIRSILLRAACYGSLIVKRAFADWSRPGMRRFKTVLHHHAIEPVHLFSYTPGKNAADSSSMACAWCRPTATSRRWRSACGARGCGCTDSIEAAG